MKECDDSADGLKDELFWRLLKFAKSNKRRGEHTMLTAARRWATSTAVRTRVPSSEARMTLTGRPASPWTRVVEVVRTFLMPLTEGVRPSTVAFCVVANSAPAVNKCCLTGDS